MTQEATGRKKLGEYLIETGLITEQQLKEALRCQRQSKEPLGQILARQGIVSERAICLVLQQQLGLPIVDLTNIAVDEQTIGLIREDLAKKYTAFPLELENRNTVRVAMADPLNVAALDDIRFQSGYFVRPALAPPSEILEAIAKFYHLDASVVQVLETIIKNDPVREVKEIVDSDRDEPVDELVKVSAGPPIVRLANWLLARTVEMRASDIHIEPQEKAVSVRVRIDGLLQELERLPKWTQGALVSRLKILASLDIAEKRFPQDGRFRVELEGRRIDLRVSTLPTVHGEKMVIRVLDQDRAMFRLDSLGLSATNLERIRSYGMRPQGIVIVTGPTGSGKTTMLYSLLHQIQSVTKNIVTVEDPIECQISGVSQVQVDEKSRKTFAAILRAMLRQDPDVMMIGEVRDPETAQIAFRAAITGHLVLSTVHTNDAPAAVTRLVDLGLEPYMVASSLIAVVSMRLVRELCPKCKDAYVPGGEELRRLGVARRDGRNLVLYQPVGCPACYETGYRGRTGVFEALEIDDAMRRLIASGVPDATIRQAAREKGMVTIGQDGLAKVLEGRTSLEELERVIYHDEDEARICLACCGPISEDFRYCPHCGRQSTSLCPRCDRRLDPAWHHCPGCGAPRPEQDQTGDGVEELIGESRPEPGESRVPVRGPREAPQRAKA